MLSIITVTLAFIFGTLWGLYLEINFLIIVSFFMCLLMLILFIFKDKFKILLTYYIPRVLMLIIIFLIGCFYTKYKMNIYDSRYVEGEQNGKFTIISHATETSYYYKYYAKNNKKDKFVVYFKKDNLKPFDIGTTLYINGKFEIPNTARNNGGFDYKLYLNTISVFGTIKVSNYKVLSTKTSNLIYIFQNLIRDKLIGLFPKDYAGILSGMLIGETNDISEETKENFKYSGITHLLAVSGSNVSLVISISVFVFSKIVGKKYSSYCSIFFTIFFIILSGSSPSVLRAGIMGILKILADILIRDSNSINNVFTSALIILLINPLSISNVGFILSFAGTIGIILLSDDIKDIILIKIKNEFLAETLSITISAQIVLLPIMAYFFNNISIVSLFTNIMVVPIAGALTILGLVIFVISILSHPIAVLLSYIITLIISYVVSMAKFFSSLKFLNFLVITPNILEMILYYLILYIVIALIKGKVSYKNYDFEEDIKSAKFALIKYVAISIVAILVVINVHSSFPRKYIELNAIDVGQGDSFLIQDARNHNILIDGGGSERGNFDVGSNTLVPYLLDKRVNKIDLVFISHPHADHIDGIFTVIEKLKVKQVVIGPYPENDEKIKELINICQKRKTKIRMVSRGDTILLNDLRFEILYPDMNVKGESNINNLSLVIKAFYGDRSILFTGDIEKEVEEKLDKSIKADILKVSHHGGNTSSTPDFLDKVSPKIALIGVVENNTYGHPSKSVIDRLSKYATIYLTKDDGEITLRIYKDSVIFVKTFLSHKIKMYKFP